jgi:hypothetical protein
MINIKVSKYIPTYAILLILAFAGCSTKTDINWPVYLGDHHSSHFVDAVQITRENVSNLQVAWTFEGGEADPKGRSQIQCNPLINDLGEENNLGEEYPEKVKELEGLMQSAHTPSTDFPLAIDITN